MTYGKAYDKTIKKTSKYILDLKLNFSAQQEDEQSQFQPQTKNVSFYHLEF
jgi:hypothetical protein